MPLLAAAALGVCAPAGADPGTGSVDIGDGRRLYLQCEGSGSPTVFVIPGKGSYAQAWNYVMPPDDPARASPYDTISQAQLVPSPDAVQPTVARTTRVCVYDRPGTRPDGDDRSTPVPQPHTVTQDVEDIVALLAAAQIPTPVVIAAHSYGGLIADLLVRSRPDLVSGLVLVDPTSEFLPAVGTPVQNAAFERAAAEPEDPGGEGFLAADAFRAVAAAPPLPRIPAVVLSSDRYPPPEQVTADNYTLAQIHQANSMLAGALGTVNITDTDSGHSIMLYQPQLVADQIVAIVERVRAGAP